MKYVFKMPGTDEYFLLKNVQSFRLAGKTKEYPNYRVFITIIENNDKRYVWHTFKSKASGQNFCAKLAKAIERVWEHG